MRKLLMTSAAMCCLTVAAHADPIIALLGAASSVDLKTQTTTYFRTVAATNEQPVIMTGGEKGDYYQVFAPPLAKVLDKAWVDATIQASAGTPANMKYVAEHPTSYALAQGNVYAGYVEDPAYKDKFQVLSSAIGNEALLGIVNEKTFQRSKGSFGALAMHATQVRWAMPPADSGTTYTFKEMQKLDPDNLGRANAQLYNSVDDAITAVKNGQADVTLIVQFANPNNARFKAVKEAGLHFIPIIYGKLKGLEIPNVGPAFKLCNAVEVSSDQTLDATACSPILAITGASNDNPDLKKVFATVSADAFTPQDTGWARLWKKTKVLSASTWDSITKQADDLAGKISGGM